MRYFSNQDLRLLQPDEPAKHNPSPDLEQEEGMEKLWQAMASDPTLTTMQAARFYELALVGGYRTALCVLADRREYMAQKMLDAGGTPSVPISGVEAQSMAPRTQLRYIGQSRGVQRGERLRVGWLTRLLQEMRQGRGAAIALILLLAAVLIAGSMWANNRGIDQAFAVEQRQESGR